MLALIFGLPLLADALDGFSSAESPPSNLLPTAEPVERAPPNDGRRKLTVIKFPTKLNRLTCISQGTAGTATYLNRIENRVSMCTKRTCRAQAKRKRLREGRAWCLSSPHMYVADFCLCFCFLLYLRGPTARLCWLKCWWFGRMLVFDQSYIVR